ncbi:hypothetical protein Ahia01_000062700, partial [Argonauta hians]
RTTTYTPCTPKIIFKDHKPNFSRNLDTRLIFPTKSDIARISKTILDRVVPALREKIKLSQWTHTRQTLDWFYKIKTNKNTKFLQIDICSFYSSINQTLLDRSLDFAIRNSDLTTSEMESILAARRTLVSFANKTWTKADNPDCYDIPMGASDPAQVTDLVGLFLLKEINYHFPRLQGGAYRDDFLFIVNSTARNFENIKKEIHGFFNRQGLSVEIGIETRTINYLDSTLNLDELRCEPYHKPREKLSYISQSSNHTQHVKVALTNSIATRISGLSHDLDTFNRHADRYNRALQAAGYNTKITFDPTKSPNPKIHTDNRNTRPNYNRTNTTHDTIDSHRGTGRKLRNNRNKQDYREPSKKYKNKEVIWFNPPYNLNVKTKVGKLFFEVLESSIPKEHRYRCILNRNIIKLSYATVPNIKNYIDRSNSKKLKEHDKLLANTTNPHTITQIQEHNTTKHCNCRNTSECPAGGECWKSNLVYKCEVTSNNNTKRIYLGQTSNIWKKRLANHISSFSNPNTKNATSLARHIWELKTKAIPYNISWSIIKHARPTNKMKGMCPLCTSESICILRHRNPEQVLNREGELAQLCIHKRKLTFAHKSKTILKTPLGQRFRKRPILTHRGTTRYVSNN